MPYSTGSLLPEYRVKASIDPSESSNRLQDDEYARRFGFRAGLVPGLHVFAYMSRVLVEFTGKEWLERGTAEVRFLRPTYEGEEIRVGGSVSSVSADGTLSVGYQAYNNKGEACGIGVAQVPSQAEAAEPSPDDYPAGRAKLHRPISLESLEPGEPLTPVSSDFTWNIHWQYCQKTIRDHHPIYERTLHPGWLVSQASRILSANFAVPAWIDVSCRIRNFHLQDEECSIETRGRIQGKYERDGDHFIELDLAVFAQKRCLETIRYTAIFRIAPNAA
jgi:hypothetical protein